MSPTLLFDLDNTLLGNDMGQFMPAYFRMLVSTFEGYDPDHLIAAMMQATRAMLANESPEQILEEVFDKTFFPLLGKKKAEFGGYFDRFYREAYPALRSTTRILPDAFQVVKAARERGFRLVVATNPLFPPAAIYQRLDWAGFDDPDRLFDLVTSSMNVHYAKPHSAYYAEILARLGWPEGPVIMVGDDPINDIQGARDLGLATYRVKASLQSFELQGARHAVGPLSALFDWLDSREPDVLVPEYASPASVKAIARSTLAAMDFWLRGNPDIWEWRSGEGGWTVSEIVCHLRDVEKEGYAVRLDLFEGQDEPFLPGLDTESWYEVRNYGKSSGQDAYGEFSRLRRQTIRKLAGLEETAWNRPARHAIFGPTDFLESMRILAGHDQIHVKQIFNILESHHAGRIE